MRKVYYFTKAEVGIFSTAATNIISAKGGDRRLRRLNERMGKAMWTSIGGTVAVRLNRREIRTLKALQRHHERMIRGV